jgi:hypothetical protein
MEIFIATDTASVQLFFNIFATGIETFVIPWDQLLKTCVVEVCRTASLLQEFSWEVFNHPPYSPDLAPSDFHIFLHLKKFHQRFENDREANQFLLDTNSNQDCLV